MTNRLINRVRHSNPDLELLPIEKLGRSRRGLSLEVSSLIGSDGLYDFRNKHLIEVINKTEKINKNTRLENLLYSRYLRRVVSSKMIETYDDYEDESDVISIEKYVTFDQTTVHARLPEIARRLSTKRTSVNSSKLSPSWSKLVNNWREYMYEAFLLRVEQEKVSIAAYEIEQTKLDWERMKINAHLALDHCDVLLRVVKSDEIAQEILNHDLEKNINTVRHDIPDEKSHRLRLPIPAELLISHINKRIHSHIRLIGLLHINTARTQLHIRSLDATIHDLDHLHEKMHEIDINFVRTRQIDYVDTYEKLDRQYKIEKSSQYPLLYQLQELKEQLSEQEQKKIDYEYKFNLLGNRVEKINDEIKAIEEENAVIFNENNILRKRIADIQKVPSITNYAYVIERTKKLQHEIDVWTRRVAIGEVSVHMHNENLISS